ncbi:MAG TPA: histidine utilization repressor [Burkholderiaceae bacterium]
MTSPGPQYLKVKNHLRDGVKAGTWAPGERLASESALTAQFGVSRMTVNRALRELEQEGLIERVQGVGTFVAQLHRIASTLQVRDVQEEIRERGHSHASRVHALGRVKATAEQAKVFGLKAGATLFHSLIVHLENGVAIQCEDRLVNPACAPDYLALDFTQATPTQHLLEVAPLTEARYTIEATLPSETEARLLAVGKREPCLLVQRLTFSGTRVVTSVRLLHPGSRYVLQGSLEP